MKRSQPCNHPQAFALKPHFQNNVTDVQNVLAAREEGLDDADGSALGDDASVHDDGADEKEESKNAALVV